MFSKTMSAQPRPKSQARATKKTKRMTQKDQTAAKRKALERDNKTKAGLVRMELWVTPEQRDKLKKAVEEMKARK